MSKRLEEIRKELEGTIYTNRDEIDVYIQLRSEGMAEVGAIETLNSFGIEELKAIASFRRLYSHYFPNIQAERVQELEEQLQGLHVMYDIRLSKSDEFEKQNKRYREAIEDAIHEYKTGNQDYSSGVMADILMAALLGNESLESDD